MRKADPEMPGNDVIELVQLLSRNNIDVCIDGGWGVDALLDEQTRLTAETNLPCLRSVAGSAVPGRRHDVRQRADQRAPRAAHQARRSRVRRAGPD